MILIITEKARISKKYAAAMRLTYKDGALQGTYEGKDFVMLNASGHLLTLKYPEEMVEGLTWQSLEKFKKIPRHFELRVQDPSPNARPGNTPEAMYKKIEKQLKRKDLESVWLATDADDEGELLGWEILEYAGYKGPVERLWLSRGEDSTSIKKAINERFSGDKTKSIAHAAEARRRADWMYMFLVRTYTYFGQYKALGNNLGSGRGKESVVSVGRVQTPTLGMIVKRDLEILNFQKQDHYSISASFKKDDGIIPGKLDIQYSPEVRDQHNDGIIWQPQGKPDENKPDKPLFVDKKMVDDFLSRLKTHGDQASVLEYEEGSRLSHPSLTYSLTDAQSDIGKKMKISGGLVQHIISDLYEQDLVSYPRTASAELPIALYSESEMTGMLRAISHHEEVAEAANKVKSIHVDRNDSQYKQFTPKAFVKGDMAHHGLVPTHKAVSQDKLNDLSPAKKDNNGRIPHTSAQMKEVYLMIVKRFLGAMLPPAKLATQKGKISVPTEDMLKNPNSIFSIKGERVVDPGHLAFFGNPDKEAMFPALSIGEAVPIHKAEAKSESTKPPSRYNEATLPKEMENVAKHISDPNYKKIMKHAEGIGTVATRAAIIETLINRGYVEVQKGTYFSTPKGRDLIDIIPEPFSAPETTAVWEEYLSQIKDVGEEEALKKQAAFVNKQADRLEKLISIIIDTFTPKMGERRSAAPRKVSEKMKKVIEIIAKIKDEQPPKGAKTNGEIASKYIDENKHLLEQARNAPPSEGQIKFVNSIRPHLPEGTVVDEAVTKNKIACSKFIEEHKHRIPPSEKQIAMAKGIADKLADGEKPSDDIYLSSQKCSQFIDKHIKKK